MRYLRTLLGAMLCAALVCAQIFGFNRSMSNNFPFFVGLRYMRSRRSNGFASLISVFSFGAMALGVLVLITVLSVMNGFNQEIRQRILNVIPHGVAAQPGGVEDWRQLAARLEGSDRIIATAPVVEGFGLLSSGERNKGVQIQGVLPDNETAVTAIADHMLIGDFADLRPGEFGIVLGSILARSLGAVRGSEVLLSLPELNVTPAGVFPRFKRFRVVGVFQVGAQVDDGIAFIHYRDAQRIYRTGDRVDGVRFRVTEPLALETPGGAMSQDLPGAVSVTGWHQQLGNLFQAIRTEKIVVGLLLSAIVAVAAFNIIASLVLLVTDKRKDIAVLKTQGANAADVFRVFVIQGSAIGFAGVAIGVLLGCLLAYFIGDIVLALEEALGFYVFDPSVYFISKLPSQLMWQDVSVVAGLGFILSVLATLYPAFRAGQVLPAEALRYDQ